MERFFGLGGGTSGVISTSPKSRPNSGAADKDGKKKQKATDLFDDAFNADELLND